MYPITEEVAKLYKEHYRQVVSITFRSTDGETIYLTEEDIIQKGFEIDRYVVSGSKLEIGSAIAAQLTVTLNNYDEKFEDVTFEGAELCVNLGVKKWDADAWEKATIQYMPLGYFTVDETPRKTAQITLTALDRMANFDKDADLSNLSFPCTVKTLLEYTCNHCVVPLYEDNLDNLPNITYSIPEAPDTEDITFRQIIQWIGEITGTCAYIDWNGYLRLTWFVDTDIEITKGDRYTGSDLYENDISITGVQITDLDDETYTSGTDDYCFNIEGNSLIQDSYQDIVDNLGKVLTGTTYRPFSCTTVPMPYVYPMDYITYVDKKGVSHSTLVTHTVFTLNSATTIKAVGETSTSSGYASVNPLTARERLILEKMKKSTSESIDELSEIDLERYNQLLEMNQLMANSFGLYLVEDTSGGGTVYYFADTKSLEDATVIYCFTENGFAWTTGEDCWNDGDPAWEYGFTRDGNAILNILTAYKVTADQIETETLNVSEILSNEDGDISITADRFTVTSDYFNLNGANGTITIYQNTYGKLGQYSYIDSSGIYGYYHPTAGSTYPVKYTRINGIDGIFMQYNASSSSSQHFYINITSDATQISSTVLIGIVSNVGIKLTGATTISGNATVTGTLECEKAATFDDSITVNGETSTICGVIFNGDTDDNAFSIIPPKNNTYTLGAEDYRWGLLASVVDTNYFVNNSSDRRLKKDIQPLTDKFSTFFDRLKPVEFRFKADDKQFHTGFIAQEVEEALEETGINEYSLCKERKDGTKALAYDNLIALCVKEIQALKQRVADLEKRIKE